MTPLKLLDDWIHKNVMNPTFVWVQKMFHWNRFQLIKWFSIAFEIVLILEICLVDKQLDRKILDVIIAGIFLLYILRCLPLLSSISKEFEETGTYKLPKELDVWSRTLKSARPFITFLVTLSLILVVTVLFLSFLTIILKVHTPELVGLKEWLYFFHGITLLVALHLWDIDDVNPRDRSYLLGWQTARDIA